MTRYRLVACSDGPLSDTQLAEAVAERIFQIGKEYNRVPHRIEYKIMINGRELAAGGLAREPFTEYVRQAIDSAISSAKGEV